jgi:GNAT superfamily N-acetyltransferase
VILRELSAADLPAAAVLLSHLNPDIPSGVLRERLESILADHPHYHIHGAFLEGELAAVASAWIATKIWCGRYLEVDNLVVHPDHRSAGLGTALIRRLEEIGREQGCNLAVLDSYTSNHASHRLYHRLGFEIWGFHFVKPFGPLDR